LAEGNTEAAERLLSHGAILESLDYQDATPLMLACLAEREDTVRALLHKGAKADHVANNSNKYRCIHIAARCGNIALVTVLLEYGASEDVQLDQPYLDTPLHLAASWSDGTEKFVQTARKLLDFDADVNSQNGRGRTALHEAIENQNCNREMVRLLLDSGGDIDILDVEDHSPLYYAVQSGSDHAQILWDPLSEWTKSGISVLLHAAKSGNRERVKQLLDAGYPKDGRDPFGRVAYDVAANSSVRDLLIPGPAGNQTRSKTAPEDRCIVTREGGTLNLEWWCDSCERNLSDELFYRKPSLARRWRERPRFPPSVDADIYHF
jgi:ankyrin repeat protein